MMNENGPAPFTFTSTNSACPQPTSTGMTISLLLGVAAVGGVIAGPCCAAHTWLANTQTPSSATMSGRGINTPSRLDAASPLLAAVKINFFPQTLATGHRQLATALESPACSAPSPHSFF